MKFKVSNPASGLSVIMDEEAASFLSEGARVEIDLEVVDQKLMIVLKPSRTGFSVQRYNGNGYDYRIQTRGKNDYPQFGAVVPEEAIASENDITLTLPEFNKLSPAQKRTLRPQQVVVPVTKPSVIVERRPQMTLEQRETFKKVMYKMNKMLAMEEFANLRLTLHNSTEHRPTHLTAELVITKIEEI